MIEYCDGDLLIADTDYVVNTVNTEGVMGKGLARQFAFSFPAMLYSYKEACKNNELFPGALHLFQTDHYTIVNFPTKTLWRLPGTYGYITKGLAQLHNLLSADPSKSIAIPALGCGLGQLDWQVVQTMITDCLGHLPNRVVLYAPRD